MEVQLPRSNVFLAFERCPLGFAALASQHWLFREHGIYPVHAKAQIGATEVKTAMRRCFARSLLAWIGLHCQAGINRFVK